MIEVILYSRADCHLCEQARADLDSLQAEVPHLVNIIDVDSDVKLRKEFGFNVPVVEIGPYRLKAPINQMELLITLRAVQNRENQKESMDRRVEEINFQFEVSWTRADRFSYWLSRHYLAVFNTIIFLYVGIPFLAPILMNAGAVMPAKWIYRAYGVVCHQLAFRSWFLFGEQYAYPKETAGLESLIPYGQATGLNEDDYWAARGFEGSSLLGFKVALCERDIAIYVGILTFGIVYSLSGRKIKSLHWIVWIILGIVPIGLDGVSQLLSQPPLNIIPYRESTPLLRTITGGLFGALTAWFGYPMVEDSMAETRRYMASKLEQVIKQNEMAARDGGDSAYHIRQV